MAKPNFFIIGPPKCATTSLYNYLKQHPQIFLSSKKETRFFDLEYEKGIDFFENTYFNEASEEIIVGEATATYFFLPFVAERLYKHYPEAKLLISFRDPVERSYSEWLMNKSLGREPLSFRDALKTNAEELNKTDLSNDKLYLKRCELMYEDLTQSYRLYIQSGMYKKNVEKYLSLFPKDNILLISSDQLKMNPSNILKRIFSFLEVDENYIIEDLKVKNPYSLKKKYKTILYDRFGKDFIFKFWQIVPSFIRRKVLSVLEDKRATKPKLTKSDKIYASEFFKSEKQFKVEYDSLFKD